MIQAMAATRRRISHLSRGFRDGGLSGAGAVLTNGLAWRLNRRRQAQSPAPPARSKPAPPISLDPQPGPARAVAEISVIVTSCNRSELLPIALRSVQMQSWTDWECIVVDDASTDDSVAVAQSFAEVDQRFRVVAHDRRLGLATARNTGIACAQGRFVCFLDDDDFLLHGSLDERATALDAAPRDVIGTYCDWINTDPHVQLEVFSSDRKAVRRGRVTFSTLRDGAPFIATSPMLRRLDVIAAGGFDESLSRAEDTELWFRLARLGFAFHSVQHVGVAYRRSPGSMVLSAPISQLDVLTSVFEAADVHAAEIAGHGPLPVHQPLSELALPALLMKQQLRYLALIAVERPDEALARGLELLPVDIRREIDPVATTQDLVRNVMARSGIRGGTAELQVRTRIGELVMGLVPSPASCWTPTTDPDDWIERVSDRATEVGISPQVVDDARSLVAGAVVLVVEAKYHVDEFGPVHDELVRRGHRACFMLSPKTVRGALLELGRYVDSIAPFDLGAIAEARAVLALNDWGPVRDLIEAANAADVPTFAKVEGVQDFDDVDTGRIRRPYRSARTVLGQGQNDARALPDARVEVVGSTRLERIWRADPVERPNTALINLNFTYHVLTEHRKAWMDSIRRAIRSVGCDALVSCHPAERSSGGGLPVADKPFRHEITRAGVLISRFSTVPFEAMARGVPFIYHNPHGERVPTFLGEPPEYWTTSSSRQLATALREALGPRGDDYRARARPFFEAQVDMVEGRSSEERTVDLLEAEVL